MCGLGEKLGGELMRRRAGQPAAAETIGEAIELQPRVRLPRAVADQRDGVADEIGVVLAEQLDAVGDRRDRADQVMAQPRGQQLHDAQGAVTGMTSICTVPAVRQSEKMINN